MSEKPEKITFGQLIADLHKDDIAECKKATQAALVKKRKTAKRPAVNEQKQA